MCSKLFKGFLNSVYIYIENDNINMLYIIWDIHIFNIHLNIQYMSGESMIFDI